MRGMCPGGANSNLLCKYEQELQNLLLFIVFRDTRLLSFFQIRIETAEHTKYHKDGKARKAIDAA